MVRVTFRCASGDERAVDIGEGETLMEGAVRARVAGIEAACGGSMSCGTCQVYVDNEWLNRLQPPNADERLLLDYSAILKERSRLACQIVLTSADEGLIVDVPESQHGY